MSDLRPVTCRYCGQTFLSDDLEKCAACGKVGGMREPSEADALARLVAQKQAEPRIQSGAEFIETVRDVRRWILGSLTAVGFIALGLLLILAPDLRSNPRVIGSEDLVRGLVPILLGVALLGYLFYFYPRFRRRRRAETAEQEPGTTERPGPEDSSPAPS
jgi:hypothetical protein